MIVLKCLLVLGIFGLVVLLSLQVNRDFILSLTIGCLCVLALNFRSLLRPELFALLLGLITLNLLEAFKRSGRRAWLLALLPVSLVWANTHGSFLLNLALPGLFAVGAVLDAAHAKWQSGRPFELSGARRTVTWLIVAWLGMLMSSLCNPFGAHLLAHTLQLSGSEFIRNSIAEWQPIYYHAFRGHPFLVIYTAFSLTLAGSLLVGRRWLQPSLLLLLVPFWLLSITAIRHGTWFALIGSYVLAHTLREQGHSRWRRRMVGAALVSVALLVGVAVAATFGNVRGRRPGFARDMPLDADAIAFLHERKLTGNVFNAYEYGDQLIYHFYPAVRVALDSRIDAYGEQYYMQHRRLAGRSTEMLAPPSELIDFLDRYEVTTIVTHPLDYSGWKRGGHTGALGRAGFSVVYHDRTTVVLARGE
jgi:hypothetical protein